MSTASQFSTARSSDGPGRRLRSLLESALPARVAGAHDGLSALVVQRAGFDAIWASSFGISATRGLPDMSLLSMSDYLQATAQMVEVTDIPVLADCDTGFGTCMNVAYMVQRYEAAGVAGVCIEDKVFPKRNSFVADSHQLLTADEFARKVARAKEAQGDQDFVVVARTEALISGRSLEEALARAHRYVDAGADAVLVHSKQPTPEQILSFLTAWHERAPVVVVPTTYYSWHLDDAASAGAAAVIYANQVLRAMVRAATDTLRSVLISGSSRLAEQAIAPIEEIFELERMDAWLSLD